MTVSVAVTWYVPSTCSVATAFAPITTSAASPGLRNQRAHASPGLQVSREVGQVRLQHLLHIGRRDVPFPRLERETIAVEYRAGVEHRQRRRGDERGVLGHVSWRHAGRALAAVGLPSASRPAVA